MTFRERNFPPGGPARRAILTLCAILTTAPLLSAQNLGAPPALMADASDIYRSLHVPINDVPGTPVSDAAAQLQMGIRAKKLGLTTQSAVDAWTGASALLGSLVTQAPAAAAYAATFNGSSASDLNAFLNGNPATYVRVLSASIVVDQTIDLNRDGLTLDLGSAQISAPYQQPYALRVRGSHNVTVLGGVFLQGSSGILVSKSANVLIDHTAISNVTFDGIVVNASSNVTIGHSRISGVGAAGVLVSDGSSGCVVAHNEISGGKGQSNWNAGIVVTDRDVDLSSNPMALFVPGNYYPIYEPIEQRLNPPAGGLIAYNHISLNAASGIYLDGAVRFTVYGNTIQANAKEGICLDNGSTANIVTSNAVQQNGDRWGQTDAALQMDFEPARLADGTGAAKLPGISMDNSIYNLVFANNISHNYGGGVKMVRTSFFNVVALNAIENDNDGVNVDFQFFGVQLGAAPADAPTGDIDFAPSRGNVVASNVIRGAHAAGIYIQLDSTGNELIDNVIRDATDWAIESVLTMDNASIDNVTDMPSQNIGNGCCTTARNRRPGKPLLRPK
jgi:parallel beta-helix repeat protein